MSVGIGKGTGKGSRKVPSPAASAEVPHYHGHRERLRTRFEEAGAETLPDYELLELLLFRSIPRRDVKPLAKELIQRFGSFAEVLGAPAARLAEVDGVSESVALDLKIVEAALKRMAISCTASMPTARSPRSPSASTG